jgi:DNA-directed RNA polymerase subunit M/transcription elongation factor TFIIS
MEKHFTLEFPNAIPLSYETYYADENYNAIRRCKIILFSDCLGSNKELDTAAKKKYISDKKRKDINKILAELKLPDNTTSTILSYLFEKIITKEHIVKQLERGCLNRTINKSKLYNIRCIWADARFVDLYHNICYKLATNLDENSSINSEYVKNKILSNAFDLQNVANMSSKDLCPDRYEKIDKKINQRNNLDRKIKYSELYKCSKCKRSQCTTERRYARSLDEGTDLTVICLFCGHSWCA